MAFKKGQKKPAKSGRKLGVGNKVTRKIGQLARGLFDEEYFSMLKHRLKNGTAAPAIETLMHYFAFGRPVERVQLETDTRVTVEQFRALAGLGGDPDDEPEPPPKPPPKKPRKPRAPAKVRARTQKPLAVQGI